MTAATKDKAPPQGAYTIAEFCQAHRISVPMFYKLQARGEAPQLMDVGTRRLVSIEAAAAWRRDRERAAQERWKAAHGRAATSNN